MKWLVTGACAAAAGTHALIAAPLWPARLGGILAVWYAIAIVALLVLHACDSARCRLRTTLAMAAILLVTGVLTAVAAWASFGRATGGAVAGALALAALATLLTNLPGLAVRLLLKRRRGPGGQ